MLSPREHPNGGAILVMLLTTLGIAILSPSRLPLLEQSVCRSYYQIHDPSMIGGDGSVPEMQCKDPAIQTKLASLSGWAQFFIDFPGLVLTVPYGRLAETTSKRVILSVNTISYVFSMLYFLAVCNFYEIFNIKMIWLSCVFDIFGGGIPILNTLLYTFIAEGTDPEFLSSTYYALSASLLTTKFLGTTTGAFLLQRGIWLPPRVGIFVYSLAIPSLLLLPSSNYRAENSDVRDALLNPEIPTSPTTELGHLQPSLTWKIYLVTQFRAVTIDYTKSFYILADLFVSDKRSRFYLAIFFFNIMGLGVRIVFPQWASMFFKWTLAETSYVFSFELFVNGAILVLLPWISQAILKPRLGSTRRVDLWVVKASLSMNIIGVFFIGFAPTRVLFILSLTVYSIGVGLHDSLKSFATSFLRKEQITRLYIGISLVETIGGMIAGPLWTGIFSLSLQLNSLGNGLPFWLSSLSFLCAFLTVVLLERSLKAVVLSMPLEVGPSWD